MFENNAGSNAVPGRLGLEPYDLLLATIPLPMLAAAVTAAASPLRLVTAVGVGSVVSAALVAYALFVASPTGGTPTGGAGGRSTTSGGT